MTTSVSQVNRVGKNIKKTDHKHKINSMGYYLIQPFDLVLSIKVTFYYFIMYVCMYVCMYISIYILVWFLSCVGLFCDPMDCSLSGSSVHGIFQTRILEWVGIFPTQGLNLHLLHWQADYLLLINKRSLHLYTTFF